MLKDFSDAAFRLKKSGFLSILKHLFIPSFGETPEEIQAKKKIIPYLISAYGLEDLAKIIPDFDFAKALEWQKLKGTPESIILAMELIGVSVRSITELKEERWNLYKVLLENSKRISTKNLIGLCKLSVPLRCKLYRIADVSKEVRSMKLSSKDGKLHKNILSNFSGIFINGLWIDL